MEIVGYIIAGILLLIGLVILYRWFTVRRQTRKYLVQSFARIKPFYDKLDNGITPSEDEIEGYAADFKTRYQAYYLLQEYGKTDLFPEAYHTIIMAAEGNLVTWLEFPTELDAMPDEIEHLEKVIIDVDGNDVNYHVFQFRVNEPHWAAKDGWMLGVVGPYVEDSEPYDMPSATFSRLHKVGETSAVEEAKWVHENISLKE